jgi:hypothetical protein
MGWIEDFKGELSKYLDTPDSFLEAIGYFVSGVSLANRVFVKSPDETTTNIYLVLCSPPGWYHKSTAIRTATRMIRSVIPQLEEIPSNPSAEALAKIVAKACENGVGHGVMVYDEFRSFLTHVRKEYAAPVASLVMEKLDRGVPVKFARKKDGDVDIDVIPEGFVLSFIASANTPWLLENMRQSDISGGMLSRFLLVESHDQTRIYELPPPIDGSSVRSLGLRLLRIRGYYPRPIEFRFGQEAVNLYSKIYREIREKANSHGHPEYPSLISRIPLYLKKLSLIRAALEGRGDAQVHVDDVERAWSLVGSSLRSATNIIDEAIATEESYGRNLVRVRKIIMTHGKISKGRLLELTHLKMRDLDEVLLSLMEQGIVKYERTDEGTFVVYQHSGSN